MKEFVLELLKITIPSLIVLLATFLVLRELLQNQLQKQRIELKINNAKLITPIRLQAYERLVLFIERISPDSLFIRQFVQGITTEQLHREALQSIRKEFEHNLSQQVYVSEDAWQMVVTAKEAILKLINIAYSNPELRENVQEYIRRVIEAYSTVDENPLENAIKFIKDEIQNQIF